MAQLLIPLRDETLKTEICEAFEAAFANPDSLSAEDLVVLHLSNFLKQVLNDKREKDAVETAKAGVSKESTLE